MHQNSENQIERLLEKPFWVIDFLPEQVSAERKCFFTAKMVNRFGGKDKKK